MSKMRVWLKGVPIPMLVIALGVFVNIVFFSFLWPVNAIYIHSVLHKSMTVTGIVLFAYSLAGFFGNFMGGWLYDRFGAPKVLSVNACICVPVIASLAILHQFWTYVVLITVFGLLSLVPFPVLNALVARAWPTGERRGYNYVYVTFNVGTAVGTAVGGLLAQWSFQAIFIILAFGYTTFFVIALTIFRRYFPSIKPVPPSKTVYHPISIGTAIRWGPIVTVLTGYGIAWGMYVQWMSVVPVYMQSIGMTTRDYSVLWTINGFAVVFLQPFVNWIVHRFPSLTVQMVGGVPFFGLSFLCLMLSHGYYVFVFGMLLLTVGELFLWPAVPALLGMLAPPNKHGVIQGAVGSFAALGRMIGPLIGGRLYDTLQISEVLALFALSVMLPFILFMLHHWRQFSTSLDTSA